MSLALGPLRGGSEWNVMTDADVLQRARDLPVGYGEMFGATFVESLITSPGLGTFIRESSTPDAIPSRDVVTPPELTMRDPLAGPPRLGEDGPVRFAPPPGTFLETESEYQQRRKDAGALSPDEWKASPSFREGIPYDPGMTADRAAALASWYDASKARQDVINRGPGGVLGTSLWIGGMLAGAALDPVNYIPIFGPEVRAAQIARFGRYAGSALTSAADAMLNTAATSAITAGTRASFGDDVSWQGFLTDIALSAVIGGAFGAATARWEGWQASRSANALEQVVAARRALNDAVGDVLHGRPIEVTPAVAEAVEKTVRDLEPTRQQLARENPGEVIAMRLRQSAPDLIDRDASLAQAERINREALDEINAELGDREVYGPVRRAIIEAEQAQAEQAQKVARLEAALAKTDSKKQRVKLQEQIDALRAEAPPPAAAVDPDVLARMQFLEESRTLRQQALDQVLAQRAEITPALEAKRAEVTAAYWDEVKRQPLAQAAAPTPEAVVQGLVPPAERPVVAAPPAEAPDPAAIRAAATVGKPAKDLAEQFGIDPKTGEFVEQAEFDQLVDMGRVTADEAAAVERATALKQQTDAYAKALEAAAICRVGV